MVVRFETSKHETCNIVENEKQRALSVRMYGYLNLSSNAIITFPLKGWNSHKGAIKWEGAIIFIP